MKVTPALHTVFFALMGFSASASYAANCEGLRQLQLPDTSITHAEQVTSGEVSGPEIGKPLKELPPFCRVQGVFHPTSDSYIRFEVWLPENHWNQRYLGVGNGGFAGSIGYQGLAGNLKRGYATAGSDAGHQANGEDASWAYHHPEKIKDFGWRAVHLTAQRTKDIIKAYYDKPATKSYFDSCSDGGREALMEAERFPEDYDGILAGAPAAGWTSLMSSGLVVSQVTLSDPAGYISGLKLPAIQQASLAACDSADGVKDGFLNNPIQCHFNPSVLLCKGQDSLSCLTAPQVKSLGVFYGDNDSPARPYFAGYGRGDETAWAEWVLGQGPGAGSGTQYVQNFFRYMVMDDPRWNLMTADPAAARKQAASKTGAELDAVNPDLSGLKARGGKLILYHGWADPAIPAANTIAYYQSVQKKMGEADTSQFVRLYMAPGVEHCLGGPGPSAFGQLGIPTTGEAKYGIFDALVDWVEKDKPADTVIATKYSPDNKVLMTRPLCPYPAIAKYKGSGDTNDAANFACTQP
jgi:hypothetical protein